MTDDLELHVMDLHGYRVWPAVLTPDGERLTSVIEETLAWVPGVQPDAVHLPYYRTAKPLVDDRPVPHQVCRCGYNAYYQPHEQYMRATRKLRVAGVVRAAGTVVMCTRGWRAQRAEILAISPPLPAAHDYITPNWPGYGGAQIPGPSVMERLADYYRVPWFQSFPELVKAFPPTHEDFAPPERKRPTIPQVPNPLVAKARMYGLFQQPRKPDSGQDKENK